MLILILCTFSTVHAEPQVLAPVSDNSSYPTGSLSNRARPSANAMYEVFGRLEQMQVEIQQLRGLVEGQSQLISKLKKRQSNIYSDLDMRLQELAGGDEQDNSALIPNGLNGQVNTNNLADSVNARKNLDHKSVAEKQLAVSEKKNQAPAPVKNQKQLYHSAYETLRNGHNVRAISAFKSLLNEFPNGEYATNSQYWLGEAYKVNRDLNSAKRAFTKVVTQHANSPKVPDALLKLGYIELEQNNTAKAKDYLTKITVNHPGTTAAHLARKKLMQMGVLQP